MKNKRIRALPVLLAALILMGGFSVPAYAQGQTEETPPAETAAPEPAPEAGPLTPEGNATLVDDYGGNKQLITVTTKSGNYFYILVDRAAEGENTVHFLNQVDEADLMALMEDGDGKAETPPAVCNCTEKCKTGSVNLSCPLCKTDTSGCTGKETAPAEPEPEDKQPEQKSNPAGMLLVVLLVAGLGGGAFYYFKVMKPKQSVKGNTDLEDFDFDEYGEDEPETEDADKTAADEKHEDDPEDTL